MIEESVFSVKDKSDNILSEQTNKNKWTNLNYENVTQFFHLWPLKWPRDNWALPVPWLSSLVSADLLKETRAPMQWTFGGQFGTVDCLSIR